MIYFQGDEKQGPKPQENVVSRRTVPNILPGQEMQKSANPNNILVATKDATEIPPKREGEQFDLTSLFNSLPEGARTQKSKQLFDMVADLFK